jgi:hypothetical protein
MTWTEGVKRSVLTVHRGMRRYHAIVEPVPNAAMRYSWELYRCAEKVADGWAYGDYYTKIEAEQALLALMETDGTLGDTE